MFGREEAGLTVCNNMKEGGGGRGESVAPGTLFRPGSRMNETKFIRFLLLLMGTAFTLATEGH